MVPRIFWLGLLVALVVATPAGAYGAPAARTVERRVRDIERSLVGPAHAAEHARQRVLSRRVLLRRARHPRRAAAAPLTSDNALQPVNVGGFWAPGVKLPIVAIHTTLLRTGKVLFFAYPWRPGRPDPDNPGQTLTNPGYADAYVFDPVTGESKQVTPPINPETGKPAYIFCSGTSTLPDGRVLVVGGDVGDPTLEDQRGLNTIYTFDPITETWQSQPRTRQGRWYPTQLEMADGRTLILAGAPNTPDPDWNSRINSDIEVFSPDNSLQRYSTFRADGQNGHPPLPGQYPHAFWMPGGYALIAGPRKSDTWRFTPPAPGAEADNSNWSDLPDLPTHREWAGGALLPGSARVMLFGGADKDDHYNGPDSVFPAVASTTIFDAEAPNLGWQAGPEMHVARTFSNSVLLPDGKVAVVGGGSGEDSGSPYYRWLYADAHRRVDLFDPQTGTFTFGNAQAEGRAYHSTALLLPDGRVMSAGDDINGPTGPDSGVRTDTAEMWSPPYLYKGCAAARRPTIASVPASVAYNRPFVVKTPDSISGAVLVAPGAVTHDNDMSQRVVPLAPPQPAAGGVTLRTPVDGNAAPPGPYMLFLRNTAGVPSVARFVMLGGTAPGVAPPIDGAPTPGGCAQPEPSPSPSPSPGPQPTASPTATPAPGALRLRLSATPPRLGRLRRTGRLSAKVTLTGAARVTLVLDLEARRARTVRLRRLASGRTLRFDRAATRTVRFRLTRAGRRKITGRRTATLRLSAVARPLAGKTVRATRRLRVR